MVVGFPSDRYLGHSGGCPLFLIIPVFPLFLRVEGTKRDTVKPVQMFLAKSEKKVGG
jgi:hypothetical protein